MTAAGPPQRLRKSPTPAPRADEETLEKEANDVARSEAGTSGDLRRQLGSRLGYDFSAVRFRMEDRSLPSGIGAETSGDTVRIAPGHFRPDLPLGRALLAHELAHVAQQDAAPRAGGSGGLGGRASIADPGGPGLSPAPRGMRQRTVSCKSPNPHPSPPAKDAAPPTSTPAPSTTPSPQPSTTPAAGGEDWNFTPAELTALKKSGKKLTFGADSGWLPDKIKENLLATLEKTLDETLKLPATEGVNLKDFYHGHLVVPAGKRTADLSAAMQTYNQERETRYKQALGGKDYATPTAQNLPDFTKAVEGTLPFAGKAMEEAIKVPGAAVIYHTFEHNTPSGMKMGDPRRNWKTPIATQTPEGYSPPDPDSASSYGRDFDDVLQFSFLIDSGGVIHARIGSTRDLSSVTGVPGS